MKFFSPCNWENPFLGTNQRKTSRTCEHNFLTGILLNFFVLILFWQKYHQELCQNLKHSGEKIGPDSIGKWFINVFFFFWGTWLQSSFKESSSTFKLIISVRNPIKTRQNIKCTLQSCLRVSGLPLIVICWFTRGAGEVLVADLDRDFCSFFYSNALDKCHCI